MRTRLSVLAGLAALAVGVFAAAPFAEATGHHRPFKGKVVGASFVQPDATCPLGFRTYTEGTGTATHLGRLTMTSNHCFTLPNQLAGGRMLFVSADGDELHVTYTGTCTPAIPSPGDLVVCTTEHEVVGGTGRFASASGRFDLTAKVTFVGLGEPLTGIWIWEGSIAY